MKDYTNYHNVNYADKLIHDGKKTFEQTLLTSPEAEDVSINGITKRVFIYSSSQSHERRILFGQNNVNWGDLVTHEGESWLVTERPFDNKIYEKSKMVLCNGTMVFSTTSSTSTTYDQYGNPIENNTTTTTTSLPCVIDDISNLKTPTGEKINVPEGDMALLVPNSNADLLKLNAEFEILDDNYRIAGIDRSKVLNSQGILMLVVKKI